MKRVILLSLMFLGENLLSVSAQNHKTLTSQSRNQIINKLISNMVRVEGGSFLMGANSSQDADAFYDEAPVHEVRVSTFYIGKYEVTQEEWIAVMGVSPLPDYYKHLRDSKSPTWNVTWKDCQQFVKKLSNITGRKFRLPTEAEWEYAARGGQKSKGYTYAGSNNIKAVGWVRDTMNDNKPSRGGRLIPNELGLYDMSGNVYEWCEDTYSERAYSMLPKNNPVNQNEGVIKVIRGGNHYHQANQARVSKRNQFVEDGNYSDTGLRLVMTE